MNTVILLIKLCIPLVSLLGITLLMSYKKDLSPAFAAPISVCIVMFFLNVGGYTNLLSQTAMAIYISGWLSAFYVLFRVLKEKSVKKYLLKGVYFYLAIRCRAVIIYAKDLSFAHPDELNHWGVVVKELVSLDAFPDARTIILYRNYTLSASLFSYFFLNVTGYSESLIYVTHGFMYIFGLSYLFKNTANKKISSVITAVVSIVTVIWAFPISFQYLLVEFPVAIFGTFLIILAVEMTQNGYDTERIVKTTSPIAISVCFIKASAYAYWLVYIAVILYRRIQNKAEIKQYDKSRKTRTIFYGLSPVIAFVLWNRNVKKLYLGDKGNADTMFSVSLDNLTRIAREKGGERIAEILKDLLFSLFTQKMAIIAMLFIAVLWGVYYTTRKDKKNSYFKLFAVIGTISWFVYYIGYSLSMVFLFPKKEMDALGTNLIAYERYFSAATGVVVLLCMYAIMSATDLDIERKIKTSYMALSATLLCVMFVVGFPKALFQRNAMTPDSLLAQELVKNECEQVPRIFSRNDRLFCYTGEYIDDSSSFNNFSFRIEFLNNNITNFSNYTIDGGELSNAKLIYYVSQNDYIAVISPHEKMFEILREADIYADYTDGRLYRVTPLDNGGYSLVKVG